MNEWILGLILCSGIISIVWLVFELAMRHTWGDYPFNKNSLNTSKENKK